MKVLLSQLRVLKRMKTYSEALMCHRLKNHSNYKKKEIQEALITLR